MNQEVVGKPKSSFLSKYWDKLSFPLFLLLITLLSYGFFSLRLGYFLDDWYIILFKQRFGAEGFWLYFSEDRPLESIPYVILFSIFNDSPQVWAIFALVMRFVFSLTFWMVLNKFFPKQDRIWKWAALIFAVFPGFKFHNFSIMFSIFYMFFSFHMLSFYGMAMAMERRSEPKKYILWTIFSMFFLFIGISSVEYYIGVELFRVILLFIVHARTEPQPRTKIIKRVFIDWIPYLILLLGFLVYRVLQRDTFSYEISVLGNLKESPIPVLFGMIKDAIKSVSDGLFFSWIQAIKSVFFEIRYAKNLELIGLLLVSTIVVYFGLRYFLKNADAKAEFYPKSWVLMPIGLFLCLISLIPFYAGGFPVGLDFPWNRFFLAMLPGISIFVVGFIEFVFRTNGIKISILTFLIVVSIGSHYINGAEFISQWDKHVELMRQFSWRIPAIEPGTALLTADSPIHKYYTGTTMMGPINLVYDANGHEEKYDYFVVLMDSNQAEDIPDIDGNNDFKLRWRSLDFHGNTDSLITYLQPEEGCVQILSDGIVPEVPGLNFPKEEWAKLSRNSNLNMIIPNPEQPVSLPARYFGEEDKSTWCYYYQKADLEKQLNNWESTINIYEDAFAKGFHPINPSEYRNLVEAWLRTGKFEDADEFINKMNHDYPWITENWCQITRELSSSDKLMPDHVDMLQSIQTLEGCAN